MGSSTSESAGQSDASVKLDFGLSTVNLDDEGSQPSENAASRSAAVPPAESAPEATAGLRDQLE